MAGISKRRRVRLMAFSQYAPTFADPAAPVGAWHQPEAAPGCFTPASFLPNQEVLRFVAECDAHGWVLAGFDWAAWAQTREARRLRDDPATLAQASEHQLAQLLTTVIRQDRFVEGTLAAAFASGLIRGIIRRASVLNGVVGRSNG